eukprot:GHVT01002842.1.p2 GENE.GHVT01002842.1~~GHVT01002842.1.p2  ORF type:complete len:143 (-),score=31.47 GHVT01002842.1:476-904(-)
MLKAASFCLSDMGEPVIGLSLEDLQPPPDSPVYPAAASSAFKEVATTSAADLSAIPSSMRETGVLSMMVGTLIQEGLPGLYKGLRLQLLKTVLAAAVLYMIRERLEGTTHTAFVRAARFFRRLLPLLRRWRLRFPAEPRGPS